jgi:hypothetical protein
MTTLLLTVSATLNIALGLMAYRQGLHLVAPETVEAATQTVGQLFDPGLHKIAKLKVYTMDKMAPVSDLKMTEFSNVVEVKCKFREAGISPIHGCAYGPASPLVSLAESSVASPVESPVVSPRDA